MEPMSDKKISEISTPDVQSTLAGLFKLGFMIVGDSRDFSNDSIQVIMARGLERITWVFPMKKAALSVTTEQGPSYLKISAQDISFDVVVPSK